MLIEIHLIQNFAPANLNRDDSGMPKDCEFGGFRRARISSQCLKSNIRKSKAFAARVEAGFRTKRVVNVIQDILTNDYSFQENDALVLSKSIAKSVTNKIDEKDNNTQYLYYTDKDELKGIIEEFIKIQEENAELKNLIGIASNSETKPKALKDAESKIDTETEKALSKYLKVNAHKINSIDIALFGRMLADQPSMKIDAACQVAHAISTNKVSMDFDYFTAIDDLNPEEETGAGMIGNLGFNSSCFYRYASLDVNKLMSNISNKKEQAILGILGYLEGTVEAVPTGKQTSFAANNPPAYVLVTISENNMPVSLANAFEKPVMPTSKLSLSEKSTQKLLEYFNQIKTLYDLNYVKEFEFGLKVDTEANIFPASSFKEMNNKIEEYLNQTL